MGRNSWVQGSLPTSQPGVVKKEGDFRFGRSTSCSWKVAFAFLCF